MDPVKRPIWWTALAWLHLIWDELRSRGIAPSQGQGPGSSSTTSQGKPKTPGR